MRHPAHTSPAAAPRLDSMLLLALTVAALLAVAWPMLTGTLPPGFPLDDGWIHATYARNLVTHGEFSLNPGTPSTGTTSLLWTALLAAATGTGLSVTAAALGAGGLALLLLVFVWHRLLLRQGMARHAAFAAAAFLPLSGITLWWSLSGMETVLFLLLAALALDAFGAGRFVRAGTWLGLLLLARPEGALLVPVLAAATWWRERRLRPVASLLLPAAAGLTVYLLWNLAVGGALWTSTLEGRRWLALGGREPGGPVAFLTAVPDMLWRWLRTLTWGMLREASFGTWIMSIGAAAVLGVRGAQALVAGRRRSGRNALPSRMKSSGVSLYLWVLLHVLAYAALLPYPGHAGRYLAPLLLAASMTLAWLLAGASGGWATWKDAGPHRIVPLLLRRVLPGAVLLAGGVLLSVTAMRNWNEVWRSSVAHIDSVHVRAAQWVREGTPREAVIACYDIGAIAFFAQRRVVDLGGLADPDAVAFMRGDIDAYILASGATYAAMVAPYEGLETPGFIPSALGYGKSGLMKLHTVREFHISPTRYNRHIGLTGNAYPRIFLQKITKSH